MNYGMLKKYLFIFSIILSFFSYSENIRKVAKSGDVEIPEGMHLVTTRTGERWLLPISMNEVPQSIREVDYYKNSEPIVEITRLGLPGHLSGPKSVKDIFLPEDKFWSRIPHHFSKILNIEKGKNLHGQSDHFSFLGNFGPSSNTPFEIPYIPIPEDEMEFHYIADFAKQSTKEMLTFEVNGRRYYRFFIHPNYPHSYEDLIKKHGIVYHYVGVTTSSPRSLVAIDPNIQNKVHWIKPSLPKKIDGSVRLNIDTKLRRAVIMSEALSHIPKSNLKDYNVELMLEPAAMQPKGKTFGTIYREVHEELLFPDKGKSWLPAFALNAPGSSEKTILEEMISKSNKADADFIREDIVRPFLKAYLNLALKEGLPGEFHTQNFYYELNENGSPTGRFIFKDNDGFRFDVELAMRNNRALRYLSKFSKPFYWAKFSNTLGAGGEKIPFLGSWYYKLIRNVGGFETLSSYILGVMKTRDNSNDLWSKKGIQRLFDDIAIEEASKMTGVTLDPDDRYGFDKNKGLNKILTEYRRKLSNEGLAPLWGDESTQKNLENLFSNLQEEKNAHLRSNIIKDTYYVPRIMEDDTLLIEARKRFPRAGQDSVIGIAIVKYNSFSEHRLKKIMHQRLMSCF